MYDRKREYMIASIERAIPYAENAENGMIQFSVEAAKILLEILKETQWIRVEDKLPDDASDVLAYYDDGTEIRIIPVNYYKGCWYDCIFNRPIDDLETGFIGYWMPLPEPPGVKQND